MCVTKLPGALTYQYVAAQAKEPLTHAYSRYVTKAKVILITFLMSQLNDYYSMLLTEIQR
jgi:hypothetical protein